MIAGRLLRTVATAALVLPGGCFYAAHFTDPAVPKSRYDGLFFGHRANRADDVRRAGSDWQRYVLFGFRPAEPGTERLAGELVLREAAGHAGPQRFVIRTRKSPLAALLETVATGPLTLLSALTLYTIPAPEQAPWFYGQAVEVWPRRRAVR